MSNEDDNSSEEVQKKHQKFRHLISYTDDPESNHAPKYKYSPESVQPFVHFFKLLALKPGNKKHRRPLILNIPDTIVFNDGDNPIMWFFTNEEGQVTRLDNMPYYHITSKLTEGALEKELVAVMKKPSYGYGGPSGNEIKVVSACEMKTVLSLVLGSRSEVTVLQRFIKSTSVKPSIVRTCWRASGQHESWSLNSNYEYTSKKQIPQICKFIVNTKIPKAFRAIKNVSEKYTKQTLKYVKNIVDFVGGHLKVGFKEFVADFMRDEGGNWWFINAKAFILDKEGKVSLKPITMYGEDFENEKPKKNLQSYTKCKKCKYCYKVVADHLMTHKLTLMMILQCDQNLIKIGKSFPWLQRCYNQHINTVNLYVEHKVCDSCYQLYIQVEKLMELERKMSKLTCPKAKNDDANMVSITSIPTFKGYSPKFGSRFQKVKYDKQMPKNWALPKNQQLKIIMKNQNVKEVKRCRFMIFIHGLRDIPDHFLQTNNKYHISYTFLNQTVKYTVKLEKTEQQDQHLKLIMNKMRVFYFFAENRDKIVDFLNENSNVKITLLENSQPMGQLELQLNDFKSDKVIKKDYFKMFSGAKVFPFLSWGLFVSAGLIQGPSIETNSLKLVNKNHLLFPEDNYHSTDPLPIQWIEMLKQKPDVIQPNNSKFHERTNSMQTVSRNQCLLHQLSIDADGYSRKRPQTQQKSRRKVYY